MKYCLRRLITCFATIPFLTIVIVGLVLFFLFLGGLPVISIVFLLHYWPSFLHITNSIFRFLVNLSIIFAIEIGWLLMLGYFPIRNKILGNILFKLLEDILSFLWQKYTTDVKMSNKNELEIAKIWCVENCRRAWGISDDQTLHFFSKEDALKFKLLWG